MTITGTGKQTRDFTHVSDVVHANILAMKSKKVGHGEVINIGSTIEQSVLEYAHQIKEMTGSKSEIVFSEDLPDDDPVRRKPDITKAKHILQWEPQTSLEDGLKKMIEYFRRT